MSKTSYSNMKDLSDSLAEKVNQLDNGELSLNELESVLTDARELYERLLIVRYKAYEKYGEPVQEQAVKVEKEEIKIEEIVEERIVEDTAPIKKETAFDFSGITEEEQPSFDFTAIEASSTEPDSKEEEPTVENEEITKAVEKNEEQTVEEDEDPNSDIFKDSHVEKHENEDANSLNSQLKSTEDEQSLRKKLQNTAVSDLKTEISIAKKFEYITFMFEGDNELYEAAINDLNNCEDGEDAKNKLNDYSKKYNWDLENKSIIKFVELVERRYI